MKNFQYTFILFSLLFAACSGTKEAAFKPNFSEDSTLKYELSSESETEISVMGQVQKTLQRQVMNQAYQVEKVHKDGKVDMIVSISDMMIDQVTPQLTIRFDSKNKSGDGMFDQLYEPLIGHEMKMTIDEKGNIQKFSGAQDVLDQMVKNSNAPGGEMFKETVEGQFGDEAMKQNFDQILDYLPGKAVKTGDSWEKQLFSAGVLGLIIDVTYTLVKRKGGKAFIDFKGKISSNENNNSSVVMGMQLKYNLNGTQSGKIEVDEKTALVIKSELNQELSGIMSIDNEMTGTMDLDTKISTKQTFKRL